MGQGCAIAAIGPHRKKHLSPTCCFLEGFVDWLELGIFQEDNGETDWLELGIFQEDNGETASKQLEQYVKVTEVFRGLAAWRNNECWCVRNMGWKDGQGLPSMLRIDNSPWISHATVNSVLSRRLQQRMCRGWTGEMPGGSLLLKKARIPAGHGDQIYAWACLVTSVVSDSVRLYGLQPVRLLWPWDSWGKNTVGSCHALLQGIFSTWRLNLCLLCLLNWQAASSPLALLGKPRDQIHGRPNAFIATMGLLGLPG